MKLHWKYRLKSGALQFSVFIAVLIALLLSALILYAYTISYIKEQSKATVENIHFADSGINYLLAQEALSNDTVSLDYFSKEQQSVKVYLSQWGIFEKAFVTAQHRQKIFTKAAIIGAVSDADSPALFLQETFNPLTLVGNTQIRGAAYLPSQGVKPGYIAGESYYGKKLIYGSIRKSGVGLPRINKECLAGLLYYSTTYRPVQHELDLHAGQKTIQSFRLPTRNLFSAKPIRLSDVEFTGNIIIKSDTMIQVKRSALLKDVLLIAPIVEIEDGVDGNFQVIASRTIKVGKNCKLNYPSALVMLRNNLKNETATARYISDKRILIDSGAVVKGSVCYFQNKEISDFLPQIVIEKSARVKGQVYCEGNFELKGIVTGSVYTKQFLINKAGTIYVNHLYEAIIENESIPDAFGGILFEDKRKTVMKWLY